MKHKWLQEEEALQTLPLSSVESSLLLFLAQIYIFGPTSTTDVHIENQILVIRATELMLQYA